MIVITNECVNCGLPCVDSCPYRNVRRIYCDECKEEKTIYDYDGEQLCIDCIEKRLEVIT